MHTALDSNAISNTGEIVRDADLWREEAHAPLIQTVDRVAMPSTALLFHVTRSRADPVATSSLVDQLLLGASVVLCVDWFSRDLPGSVSILLVNAAGFSRSSPGRVQSPDTALS